MIYLLCRLFKLWGNCHPGSIPSKGIFFQCIFSKNCSSYKNEYLNSDQIEEIRNECSCFVQVYIFSAKFAQTQIFSDLSFPWSTLVEGDEQLSKLLSPWMWVFFVSAVCASVKLIYHRAGIAVNLRLLKCSMHFQWTTSSFDLPPEGSA